MRMQAASCCPLDGTPFVPYSVNLAQTKYNELKQYTLPAGRSTVSYKDWEAQRCDIACQQSAKCTLWKTVALLLDSRYT
jgi:hypothetical protein